MGPLLATPDEAIAWLRQRVPGLLVADSRRLAAGDAFLAWPGHRADGRTHLRAALAAGAAACVAEADGAAAFDGADDPRVARLQGLHGAAGLVADGWYGQPSRALAVTAVTGTNGKTSTAWWLAQAWAALGQRAAVVGTLGIGEPPAGDAVGHGSEALAALQSTGLTTPDAPTLHAALRALADRGVRACAIEASSIGLVEHRLAGVHVDTAVFTNFTPDHLDYHGCMSAYWAAKESLFHWPGLRAAVVNVDDAQGAALAHALAAGGAPRSLWTVSLHHAPPAAARGRAGPAALHHLAAGPLEEAADGLSFDLREDGGAPVRLHTRVVGRYNASNLLGVVGALRAQGVALTEAAAAVARLGPVPGRVQRIAERGAGGVEVVVDYAHTADALSQVLQTLRPLAQARGGALWCVFGCGGDRDPSKRAPMGREAAQWADRVVVTSDNPRSEDPASIVAQVLAGTAGLRAQVESRVDRAEAIAYAIGAAGPGDVVLLAGKGHETTQEAAGVRRPFSDAAHARAALARRAPARPAEAERRAGDGGAMPQAGSAVGTGSAEGSRAWR